MAYVYVYNNRKQQITCPILRNPTPVFLDVSPRSLAILDLGENSLSSKLAHCITQRINHYYNQGDLLASCSIDGSDLCFWDHWSLNDWDHAFFSMVEKSVSKLFSSPDSLNSFSQKKQWSRDLAIDLREDIRSTIHHDMLNAIRESNHDAFLEDHNKRLDLDLPNLYRDEKFIDAMGIMSCFISGCWASKQEIDFLIVRCSDSQPYILNFKASGKRVETIVDLSKNDYISAITRTV